MNKKILVFTAFLLLALTVSACATPAAVTVNPQPQIPQLSVNGSGLVHVVPDVAYVYVGVRSEGKTVTDALNKNKQAAKDILDVIVAQQSKKRTSRHPASISILSNTMLPVRRYRHFMSSRIPFMSLSVISIRLTLSWI